jgi:peptide/nickel transport system substrate-binding protein
VDVKVTERKVDRRRFLKYGAATAVVVAAGAAAYTMYQPSAPTTPSVTTTEETAAKPKVPLTRVREIELLETVPEYDAMRFEMAKKIADQWRSIGIQVKETALAWNTIQPMLNAGNFDYFIIHWVAIADRIDPDFFCYMIHYSGEAQPGRMNFDQYKNSEYDQLALQQRVQWDPNERQKTVFACQQFIRKDMPDHYIANRKEVHMYNKNRFSNPTSMMGEGLNSFWNFMSITPLTDRKTVYWGYPTDLMALNPLAPIGAHDHNVLAMIYDRLFRISTTGQAEPWAAEKLDIIDDKTLDVTIRKGMKWHDGVGELNANDVKFTFEYVVQKMAPQVAGRAEMVDSIELLDTYKARFHMKQPFAVFIANGLSIVDILPEHIWKNINEPITYPNDKPIGSGPFKFEYWRKLEEMKLSTNKNYWQPPKVDGVLKIPFALDRLMDMMEKGDLDVLSGYVDPTAAKRLIPLSHIGTVINSTHSVYNGLINNSKEPFTDKAFRTAIGYCIPKEDIVNVVLGGSDYATVAHGMIAQANTFWFDPTIEPYGSDPEKAKQILKDAGYQWDSEGYLCYPPSQ